MKYEHLLVLGAGATAAVGGTFPVGRDFFSSNSTWSHSISDYPHLAVAQRKVKSLKDTSADTTPVSLTDAWLFLDTMFKYHCATRRRSTYDYKLLRIRYAKVNVPDYLKADYLNNHYEKVCSDMCPYFSTLPKRIYDACDQGDRVGYFLLIAGWELKHLLYKTYHPEIEYGNLYSQMSRALNRLPGNVAVISFNYDIYFEISCREQGIPLELLPEVDSVPSRAAVPFCKPHGGWNIRHLNQRIEPHRSLADFVEDQRFDKLPALEERPAMIPYFSHPDEISELHESGYPDVGKFFLKQQERMQTLLSDARAITSIGYSFSDTHVKEIVQGISSGRSSRGKSLLCVMKGDSERKDIMSLWKFEEEDGITFKYCPSGFQETSIGQIVDFFNSRK